MPDTEEKPGKPEKPEETEKAAQIDIDSLSKEEALELIRRLRDKFEANDDDTIEIIDDEEQE